jgi:HK97 family phage major capsid protein
MASRDTFEDWIPTEITGEVIQAAVRQSTVEQLARPEPMASDTKQVPRTGGVSVGVVAKGNAYAESTGTQDTVEMIARKIGGIVRIAEEDLTDTVTGERTINIKRLEATRALAKFFDNATLATTGAQNGTTVPYTSIYKAVRTTNAATSYTADANYLATGGAATYDDFNDVFGLVEDSDWYDESAIVVIASPAWKRALRGIKDSQGRPMWREGMTGDDPGSIMDYPVVWTPAARTSATATQTPTGNPLLIVANRNLMIKGMASLTSGQAPTNPGFEIQRANNGVGFTTDETLMKSVLRRGFVIGHEKAFAVVELT